MEMTTLANARKAGVRRSLARAVGFTALTAASLTATFSMVQAATSCPTQTLSFGVSFGKGAPDPNGSSQASSNLRALAAHAGGARLLPVHFYVPFVNVMSLPPGDPTLLAQQASEAESEREVIAYAEAGYPVLLTFRALSTDGVGSTPGFFTAFVTDVLSRLGPYLEAVEITNEGNVTGSANTSDGVVPDVIDDLVLGVVAAKTYLTAQHLTTKVGFNWAFDYHAPSGLGTLGDTFWSGIKKSAVDSPTFYASVDFMGLHTYPNFLSAATPIYNITPGENDAIKTGRSEMTSLGLATTVPLRITEVGYPTSNATDEANQASYWTLVVKAIDANHVAQNVVSTYVFLYQNNHTAATTADFGIVYPEPTDGGAGGSACEATPSAAGCPGTTKPAYPVILDAAANYDPRPTGCPYAN